MKTTMEMTRTFHPVGQGAFYTERFEAYNRGTFTIVYDCGSTTLSKKVMGSKIKEALPEDSQIDILFISHFHADHINGIEALKKHCRIKTVILPLLSYEAKILLKVAYYLDQKEESSSRLPYDQFEKLIDDPASFFGENETKVITIAPVEGEPHIQEGLPEAIDISQTTRGKTFASGIPLYPFQDINWFFIPFNYKQSERRKQFECAIERKGISLGDIDTIDKIASQKQLLRRAYNSIEGDLNENSMILFSGSVACWNTAHCMGKCLNLFHPRCHFYYCDRYSINYCNYGQHRLGADSRIFQSGCLYLGDINLNKGDLIEDIGTRLKFFLPCLGTIQIPHHGSKHNFDNSILKLGNIHFAVFSFGKKNRYGHPSASTVRDVVLSGPIPCAVTENLNSTVRQFIGYW